MEPLYFNKKLFEFQKSELERVDAIFSPLIETASQKQSEAYALYQKVDRKAKLEDRKLSPEELELKEKYLDADKEYYALIDEWHKEQIYSKVSAEKLTFEFFTKNTKSILSLLKHDIPLQITISALIVLDLSFVHEYKIFSEKNNINSNKDNSSEAEIVLFQDDVLREHLMSVFKPFLDFLKEHDNDGFKKACELIEKGIKNKKKSSLM